MSKFTANAYVPDTVSPPGETILETIEALGMSQTDLAERMGLTPKTVNEIVKGKTILTPQIALQLEQILGVPAAFWMNREQHYREYLARLTERELIAA